MEVPAVMCRSAAARGPARIPGCAKLQVGSGLAWVAGQAARHGCSRLRPWEVGKSGLGTSRASETQSRSSLMGPVKRNSGLLLAGRKLLLQPIPASWRPWQETHPRPLGWFKAA